jgi:drug/metabolite transporter (DMT)-like permease
MKKNDLTLKVIGFILLIDLLESTYEFFLKKGMLVVGAFNFSDLGAAGDFAGRVASNGWIWIGFLIIVVETLMWLAVLSKIDLSVAFPVSSSSYIFVLLISVFLLHEHVSFNRWIGAALIIFGIWLVARSSEEKAAKTAKT